MATGNITTQCTHWEDVSTDDAAQAPQNCKCLRQSGQSFHFTGETGPERAVGVAETTPQTGNPLQDSGPQVLTGWTSSGWPGDRGLSGQGCPTAFITGLAAGAAGPTGPVPTGQPLGVGSSHWSGFGGSGAGAGAAKGLPGTAAAFFQPGLLGRQHLRVHHADARRGGQRWGDLEGVRQRVTAGDPEALRVLVRVGSARGSRQGVRVGQRGQGLADRCGRCLLGSSL